MPKFTQKKMCSECPFRANAPPGWLGPHTSDEFHAMIHTTEAQFICHTHINKMFDKRLTEEEMEQQGQHCVGMLRYMNTVCRSSRDPERANAQKKLQSIPDQPLIPPFQFKAYHDAGILSREED